MTKRERFLALKEKYQLTNAAIAIRFGVPLRTVKSWSCGWRSPKEYTLTMMETTLARDNGESEDKRRMK
jgi:DNA-binding transcriptional regulator YiaG